MNYPKELLNALDQSISNVIERDMDRPSEYVADSILKWLNIPKPQIMFAVKRKDRQFPSAYFDNMDDANQWIATRNDPTLFHIFKMEEIYESLP